MLNERSARQQSDNPRWIPRFESSNSISIRKDRVKEPPMVPNEHPNLYWRLLASIRGWKSSDERFSPKTGGVQRKVFEWKRISIRMSIHVIAPQEAWLVQVGCWTWACWIWFNQRSDRARLHLARGRKNRRVEIKVERPFIHLLCLNRFMVV